MSHYGLGIIGIVGAVVIVAALLLWIFTTIRASKDPNLRGARETGAKRGDNTGGVVRGSPAQTNRRDEAPRAD